MVYGGGLGAFAAELTYVLGENLENLTLGQNGAALNGIGNAEVNTITGNAGANIIVGKEGADVLTGDQITAGVDGSADVFGYLNRTDSLLANFDRIVEFDIASDQFGVSNEVFLAGFNANAAADIVTALTAEQIAIAFNNNAVLANQAYFFQTTGGIRSFVAINDGTAAYNAAADAIIEVTGFQGVLPFGAANLFVLNPAFA